MKYSRMKIVSQNSNCVKKRTSLFRNWFFWLIRLIMIQGMVAPGTVQEWVQCTHFMKSCTLQPLR